MRKRNLFHNVKQLPQHAEKIKTIKENFPVRCCFIFWRITFNYTLSEIIVINAFKW